MTEEEERLKKDNDLDTTHIVWRRMKIASLGGDLGEFQRLHPEDPLTCFLSGAKSVFPASTIIRLMKNHKPPIIYGDLTIEAPK